MANQQIFRFSYHGPRKEDRRVLPHHLRDGDAFAELAAVLFSRRYRYGGLLLNYPADDPKVTIPIETSFLKPEDLLVLTTRPPLHDEEKMANRKLTRSHTSLEDQVFAVLKRYFECCARSQVILDKSIAAALPPAVANRACIQFRQNAGASYKQYKPYEAHDWVPVAGRQTTAAYLLLTRDTWKEGPGLLVAFGMGGTETLVWTHLLRTQFARLLDAPRFVLAEITTQPLPPRPTDLSFAHDWNVTILLDHRF